MIAKIKELHDLIKDTASRIKSVLNVDDDEAMTMAANAITGKLINGCLIDWVSVDVDYVSIAYYDEFEYFNHHSPELYVITSDDDEDSEMLEELIDKMIEHYKRMLDY